MNIALVVAGGVGSRTGQDVPKQFMTIYDTPVIVYTMKNIEKSGIFGEIYVVCSDGWRDFVDAYARQYEVRNYKGTILGGDTRFQSILNGYEHLSTNHNPNDTVSVIDANRPLIPESIFRQAIESLEYSDGVLPLEPCFDSMYVADKNKMIVSDSANRECLFKGQAPESGRLGMMQDLAKKAKKEGCTGLTSTGILMHFRKKVSYVVGSPKCFKITTADDFAILKALIIEENILKNIK